ncbi:hypothetical protein KVR01_000050 [Diaporthe batatas]|uniref:uncharacterized protein n=1 Tax=Diaporthe batatas TaxID=748121 RepID=UPI001D039BE3|nr:uncharacterized protein KVR01_000050 [Diaporthe batatas]KAG8169305.1 hypothetical protein KVR01_000050 [Diaporthe batatas]
MSKFEEHLPSTADDEKLARMLQSEWEDEEQRQAELYHSTPQATGSAPSATEDEKLARKLQAEWNDQRQEENRAVAAAVAAPSRTPPPPKQVSFAAPAASARGPPPPQDTPHMSGAVPSSSSDIRYSRDTARVMAYMIPLPQPLKNGVVQDVPQRYMLYMPPRADLLKPADKNTKERKRDKAVRRWQHEVRKAKTYNGRVVSLGGVHSASIRGAVWVLSLIKPADVTFLSRVPRKSVTSLVLVHPEARGGRLQSADDMFRDVKGELSRTKSRTRRDFWIGTALLPITFTIDLVIPVFGGLSEVNMVWMAVNASAWMTANRVVDKLRPAAGGAAAQGNGHPAYPGQVGGQQHDGAVMLRRSHTVNGNTGTGDEKGGATSNKEKKKHGDKDQDKTIQMVFQPSPAMDLMRRYVEEACHKRNPDAFPSLGGYVPGEAEVLASMGWSPEHREVPDAEEDVAWQIRKVTEDLREATNRAAKSWDGWARKYMKNPRKASEEEEEDRVVDGNDSSDEEDWKPELPKRPPVLYK